MNRGVRLEDVCLSSEQDKSLLVLAKGSAKSRLLKKLRTRLQRELGIGHRILDVLIEEKRVQMSVVCPPPSLGPDEPPANKVHKSLPEEQEVHEDVVSPFVASRNPNRAFVQEKVIRVLQNGGTSVDLDDISGIEIFDEGF